MNTRALRDGDAPSAEAGGADARMLSARQQQILDMLRAGKVNKEIANELGIGLGTVKQHVVALFKKLNVRNRAMAVSRGLELQPKAKPQLLDEGLLEYRPCVVVSLVLSQAAADETDPVGRLLQQTMAAHAYDHDAIFLARKLHAGDLIFGIQHSSETLMAQALHTVYRIAQTLAAPCGQRGVALMGGMMAGLAVASMNRHGGWSGEAIASAAITQSRLLAEGAEAGALILGESARELLRALGPSTQELDIGEAFCFENLDRTPWRRRPEPAKRAPAVPSLLGREAETARIDVWIDEARRGIGRTVYIEGEIGMGKSMLGDYAASRCAGLGVRVHRLLCQGEMGEHVLFGLAEGMPVPLADMLAASGAGPEAWIIDDCHLLPQAAIGELLRQTGRAGDRLILLCGRRSPDIAAQIDDVLHLGRLPQAAVRKIVERHCDAASTAQDARELTDQAMGVPLFAVELARHRSSRALPLSLRMVIGARMDRLKLDRLLLRHVAREPGTWSLAQLARSMHQPRSALQTGLDRAVASGVLARDDQDRFSYVHPLLRQAVIQAKVE